MRLQRELHSGLSACMLALTWWVCAPLQAQQRAPEPEAAALTAATFPKGPLPPHVAEQVRAVVLAQVKAFLPPAVEGAVEIDRLDKDTILTATVGGQKYTGKVFRTFLVEPLSPNEFDAKEYYVRTTTPWRLKAGLVIPADVYLSGMVERVSAYDADTIAAQEAALARSEVFYKGTLAQLEPQRKAGVAKIAEAHKAETDSLTKQITQLNAEIARKEKARDAITAQITRNAPKAPVIVRDASDNVLWEWSPNQGFTFNDGLDESRQKLDEATAAQKTLQETMAAELVEAVGQPGAKEKAIRTIFQKQCRSIRAGETISDEDMRADYESALGEPLKPPLGSGKPQPPKPADGKPPIQPVPAPKKGT